MPKKKKQWQYASDPPRLHCRICGVKQTKKTVQCYECLDVFHRSCLEPPMKEEPSPGDRWLCGTCNEARMVHVRRELMESGTPCSPAESIELRARLAAFDGFMFLLDGANADDESRSLSLLPSEVSGDEEGAKWWESYQSGCIRRPNLLGLAHGEEDSMKRLIHSGTPGNVEEAKDLSERMSVFDEFLFLVEPNPPPSPPKRSSEKCIDKKRGSKDAFHGGNAVKGKRNASFDSKPSVAPPASTLSKSKRPKSDKDSAREGIST